MFSVEVIFLPVSDVERALRFYVDQAGFTLDVDYAPNDSFRVVQFTPSGSRCSIGVKLADVDRARRSKNQKEIGVDLPFRTRVVTSPIGTLDHSSGRSSNGYGHV